MKFYFISLFNICFVNLKGTKQIISNMNANIFGMFIQGL